MAKTQLTMDIERALYKESGAAGLGVYGGFEVTIGESYGSERVDFITMTSESLFTCYEVKASFADLKSKAKLSFYGDYNYLVMDWETYTKVLESNHYIDQKIGIYTYDASTKKLTKQRKSKKTVTPLHQKAMLMHSMIRSLSRLTGKMLMGE